jgi:hypothetical protein
MRPQFEERANKTLILSKEPKLADIFVPVKAFPVTAAFIGSCLFAFRGLLASEQTVQSGFMTCFAGDT